MSDVSLLSLPDNSIQSEGLTSVGGGEQKEMLDEKKWPPIPSGSSACYRIVVKGQLAPQWSGRLGGMQIVATTSEHQLTVTTLSGQVQDQAALMGVLNSLYQLRYRILSVSCDQQEH